MRSQFTGNRRGSISFGVGRPVGIGTCPARLPARMLDTIPGALAWSALALVVIGACYAPMAVILGAALLACYSAVRFFLAAAANGRGLRLIQRWQATDWDAEYARRATPDSLPLDAVHHVVIIPNYGEDLQMLRRTLDHLARQARASVSMTVVLAMEALEPGAAGKGAQLKAEYGARFAQFLVVVHPRGLSGEVQCKSANQAWALRWAERLLTGDMGYDPDHLLVTSMDADTIWHPDTFEALTVLFAADPHRYETFWQAPIRYHANVWRTHPLLRLVHAYSSAWELAYLAAPWWQSLPMSSYSMSLRLLTGVGYWDPDVIADEWHMYIKAFFQRAGGVRLQPVFLPFYASATPGETLRQAIIERYLQTLRHAWGAKEIGFALSQMAEHRQVPARTGLRLVFRVAHDNLLSGVGWVIMVLGAQVPMLFHPAVIQQNLGSPPFVLLQLSLAVVSVLTVGFWVLDLRTRPARPAPWTWRERLYELASVPLLTVMSLLCLALPAIHAQTRLMLGLPLRFRVTAKT